MFICNPLFNAGKLIPVIGVGSVYIQVVALSKNYNLSNNTISTLSTSPVPYYNLVGATDGSGTIWLYGGLPNSNGSAQATTEKYAQSSDTYSAGANLSVSVYGASCAGNSTLAVIGGGIHGTQSSPTYPSSTSVYTFSGDTCVAGTALKSGNGLTGAAAGNATLGLFVLGQNGGYQSCTYTYSGNTVATSTSLSPSLNSRGGCGNTTTGYFGGGQQGATYYSSMLKCAYSDGTITSGTSLMAASAFCGGAAAVSTGGIWTGGSTASSNVLVTSLYQFSNDAVAAGASMNTSSASYTVDVAFTPGNF